MNTILFNIKQLLRLIIYLCHINEFRLYKFPDYGKGNGKKAMVMGNGPSLKLLFNKYEKGEIVIDNNSFFVNLAPLSDYFYKIKPNNLFLSDFVFMKDTREKTGNNRKMYKNLQERVDWPLTIYLTFTKKRYCEQLISYSGITNPNIRFVFLNRNYCDELAPKFRNWLYKKSWFMPTEGTVVNTAIYVAILQGYKEIDLYGIETDMFLNMRVDENNHVGVISKHFYGGDRFNRLYNDDDSVGKSCDFLFAVAHMLKSHHLLREFADYMNVKIYNCTPVSMVDAYERKSVL